jgi:hypothetical protein
MGQLILRFCRKPVVDFKCLPELSGNKQVYIMPAYHNEGNMKLLRSRRIVDRKLQPKKVRDVTKGN